METNQAKPARLVRPGATQSQRGGRAFSLLVVLLLVCAGQGCEQILGLDRIETYETGGAAGSTTTEGGGGTTSASGGAPGCETQADCDPPADPCLQAICTAGMCDEEPIQAGTPVPAQTSGDCEVVQCDGAGAITHVNDDADLPIDGNECTDDICVDGMPSNPPLAAGTVCAEGSGVLCDDDGACVECLAATDCPGVDDECKTRSCTGGVCGFTFATAGTAQMQTAGDCKVASCDGAGNITNAEDNTDLPDDNSPCTTDTCSMGTPVFTDVVQGTPCGPAAECDAFGQCVGCNSPADCPGTDDECKARTCNGFVCGFSFTAADTPVSDQTAGDCKQNACDGNGNTVVQDSNQDIPPDDGKQCTFQACSNGTPTFPPVAVDTPCSQNGGSFCGSAGQCVQCNSAAQCPAGDECKTATCNGTCGFSFQPAGFVTPVQNAGDCKQNQCDGAGNSVSVNSSSDLPVDGNQCTADVCTNGVPSNPSLPTGTACNQNGGTVCDGAGVCMSAGCNDGAKNGTETDVDCGGMCTPCANGKICGGNGDCASNVCAGGMCVQCLTAAQCPAGDECKTATCNSNVCGFSFEPAGFVTPVQTAGDCKVNQCDGAGNTASGNSSSDLPVDGNQCTADVCTNGVPSNPPLPTGTACAQNGGSVCNSMGSCVECNAAAECPGTDTECQTRTCTNNMCAFVFTAAGTLVSAQTAGDCKVNQCDGAGSTTSVNSSSDLPVDGNQCTADLCTAGVPSNPSLPIGTACAQNGGTVCDGTGACVSPPAVASTTPSNGAGGVAVTTTLAVTFTKAMAPATLTGQTAFGACSGSIQVSSDSFASCRPFAATTPVMSGGNTIATFTPAPALSSGTTYKIKVLGTATDAAGLMMGTTYTMPTGFTTGAGAYHLIQESSSGDEWPAQLTAPAPGTYRYTSRFSFDSVQWTSWRAPSPDGRIHP